ncbi:MAG: FAD-binding oxidoreductase [Pseudomarimonas sp.]
MMQPLPAALLAQLRACLPTTTLLTDAASALAYGVDNSAFVGSAQAVVLPTEHAEVEATIAACHTHGVAVVARGRGSNTTGASVPIHGGVVISFERMNRIIDIDVGNRVAVVEPGVLNGDLQQALTPQGFFWAPDPTSAPWSSIGGNLACNAGGPRAVKYGACRDNVLALRAVDGQGRGFRSGAAVTKNSSGLDLARLLVGSEGTLALITEATLLLRPLPEARVALRALYVDVEAAAAAVARIMAQAVIPSALEFMDAAALELVRQRGVSLPAAAGALLLIEADGRSDALADAGVAISAAVHGEGLLELTIAADAAELTALWAARKALSPALKQLAPDKINEDVVVPVAQLPALVSAMRALERQHPLRIVCFGHAGNGNLHVNLMFDRRIPAQAAAADVCLDALFDRVLALGGSLSGEHGIGITKRDFMARALDPVTLDLLQAIKRQFDPSGILNPGKLLPGRQPS